jgi:sulfite exporter TauE/SafE
LCLSWLFNRRVVLALSKGMLVGVVLAAIMASLRVGSVEDWQRWMTEYAGVFLVWRLLLYVFIARSWFCLRRRLRQYERLPEAHQRWRCMEIAVVISIVLLEASQLLRG